jgi:hypothetical protein
MRLENWKYVQKFGHTLSTLRKNQFSVLSVDGMMGVEIRPRGL